MPSFISTVKPNETDFGVSSCDLARETGRAVYVNRFRKALDEPNPVIRFRAAGDAYRALARRIG